MNINNVLEKIQSHPDFSYKEYSILKKSVMAIQTYPLNLVRVITGDIYFATEYSIEKLTENLDYAIDTLPERSKSLLLLKFKENKSIADAARELNMSYNRACVLIRIAIRKLGCTDNLRIIFGGKSLYSDLKDAEKKLLENIDKVKMLSDNESYIDSIPIERLRLSVRSLNALRRSVHFPYPKSLDTIGDLRSANLTKYDLLKIRNLGKKSMEEVITKAGQYGIEFKDDEEEKEKEPEHKEEGKTTVDFIKYLCIQVKETYFYLVNGDKEYDKIKKSVLDNNKNATLGEFVCHALSRLRIGDLGLKSNTCRQLYNTFNTFDGKEIIKKAYVLDEIVLTGGIDYDGLKDLSNLFRAVKTLVRDISDVSNLFD